MRVGRELTKSQEIRINPWAGLQNRYMTESVGYLRLLFDCSGIGADAITT